MNSMGAQEIRGTLVGGIKFVGKGQRLGSAALYADGSSTGQYIDCGTRSGQCLYEPDLCENGLTVTLWFKYPTLPTSGNIGYIMDSVGTDIDTVGISFGITDTKIFIKINLRGSSYQYWSLLFPVDTWQFITFVYSMDAGLSFYINGCDAVASRITTAGDYSVRKVPIPASYPTAPFRIGGHDDHKAEMFLDHLFIWHEILQPEEIWHHFLQFGKVPFA